MDPELNDPCYSHRHARGEPCPSNSVPKSVTDPINPTYYKRDGMEVKSIIAAWELGYNLGSAIAYILRAGKKTTDPKEDLKKAQWFLTEAINE